MKSKTRRRIEFALQISHWQLNKYLPAFSAKFAEKMEIGENPKTQKFKWTETAKRNNESWKTNDIHYVIDHIFAHF